MYTVIKLMSETGILNSVHQHFKFSEVPLYENNYSVINIHPRTISMENLAYFVSQLDGDVELVTLDELLTMVEENIPHETAVPNLA